MLDDALARRVAGALEIPFTGTLGLLIDAKKAGRLREAARRTARSTSGPRSSTPGRGTRAATCWRGN